MKQRAKNDVSLCQAILTNMRAVRLWYRGGTARLLCDAFSSIFASIAPYLGIWLTARIIDELSGERDPSRLVMWISLTLGSTLLIALINLAFERISNYLNASMNFFREKLYADKLLAMDFCRMDEQRTHELLSQAKQHDSWGYTLDVSATRFNGMLGSLSGIVGVIAISFSMFTARVPESAGMLTLLNNPLLILAVIVLMLGVTLLSPMFNQKARSYWNRYADESREEKNLDRFYGDTFPRDRSRAADIRLYRQDKIGKYYSERCNVFTAKSKMAQYRRGPMSFYNVLATVCSYSFVGMTYFIVCLKSWAGAFGVGAVTQYIGAITSLAWCVIGLLDVFGQMRNDAPFLQTFFDFLSIPNVMVQGTQQLSVDPDRDHEIEFRDVSLRYPGAERFSLRHVNLRFHTGRRLAVVGRNGSGKTTFIKLLCRMYDPTEGAILLDGVDIREYDYRDYLKAFSVVFQDFKLFAFPLAQNVASSEVYDSERVHALLQQVGFGNRLETMPEGIETYLYKDLSAQGVEISGGEAQKIAIARALYKNAPIIILDEPTAALDPIAEYEIYTRFNELVGDKTAIYISHRLSSCRFCDDIAVFEDGAVIEQGSHDTLVADRSSRYYEMWNAQAQYYG